MTTAIVPEQISRRGIRFSSLWTLYILTLRQQLHGKRWMVMLALMFLPTGLAVLVRCTAHNVPLLALEFSLAFMFIPQALLPLLALIYSTGMIQDELEDQTITYLLIRPIPKWGLYVVKLLAILTTAILLTVILTVLTYAAIYLGVNLHLHGKDVPLRCVKACAVHILAVVAYCSLFGFMGLITRRILIAGTVYIALFEGLFANLPFGIRLVTVIYYARLIAYRMLEFRVPTPFGIQDFAADGWQLDVENDPLLLHHPQMLTCLLVLLIASAVLTAMAAYRCSGQEFHVKTPEKG